MAEGISTRLQREVGQQQKELERIEAKFDGGILQLRTDLEQLSTDMRRLFEQVISKVDAGKAAMESAGGGSRGNGSIESAQLKSGQSTVTSIIVDDVGEANPRYCRYSRLECPKFEGEDFEGWLMRLEQYFEVGKMVDGNKVRSVMMQLEGRALHWYQYYAKANRGLSCLSWASYLEDMRKRFGKLEFYDPMSDLVSLKQTHTMEEYYENYLSLLNALQLSSEYALSIFISNLKSDLAKTLRL